MLALLEHPDQLAILRDDPTTLETGVEELLRWVSPIKNMSRTVTDDVELRGQHAARGRPGHALLPVGQPRRGRCSTDPIALRRDAATRTRTSRSGSARTSASGASLARLELQVMFDELLRRLPDLELAGDEPLPYRASNFISGPEAMPVRFTPTAKLG